MPVGVRTHLMTQSGRLTIVASGLMPVAEWDLAEVATGFYRARESKIGVPG